MPGAGNLVYGSYNDILQQDQTIGDVVGKSTEMQVWISELQAKVKDIAKHRRSEERV